MIPIQDIEELSLTEFSWTSMLKTIPHLIEKDLNMCLHITFFPCLEPRM